MSMTHTQKVERAGRLQPTPDLAVGTCRELVGISIAGGEIRARIWFTGDGWFTRSSFPDWRTVASAEAREMVLTVAPARISGARPDEALAVLGIERDRIDVRAALARVRAEVDRLGRIFADAVGAPEPFDRLPTWEEAAAYAAARDLPKQEGMRVLEAMQNAWLCAADRAYRLGLRAEGRWEP